MVLRADPERQQILAAAVHSPVWTALRVECEQELLLAQKTLARISSTREEDLAAKGALGILRKILALPEDARKYLQAANLKTADTKDE